MWRAGRETGNSEAARSRVDEGGQAIDSVQER